MVQARWNNFMTGIARFTKLLTSIALLVLLLTSCSEPEAKEDPRFVPQLNPHPKYFITVEGDIDPKIAKNFSLRWHLFYITNNDNCKKLINRFEGATIERHEELFIEIMSNSKNHYSYRLPIDKYFPGYCQWGAYKLRYNIISNHVKLAGANINFVKEKKLPFSELVDQWQCVFDKCKLVSMQNKTYTLNSTQNYVYKVNIRE